MFTELEWVGKMHCLFQNLDFVRSYRIKTKIDLYYFKEFAKNVQEIKKKVFSNFPETKG
jgi:hypothetical protein